LVVKRRPLEHGVFEDIEVARRYDKEIRTWSLYTSRSIVSAVKRWGISSGKALDIGTGTGWLAIGFAQRLPGVHVVGLDLSDVVLELARENAQERGVSSRVSFEKGDAQDMPFEDDTFDLVISSNTLHLLKNPVRMFDEMQRVLKSDGRFLISDFRRSWLGILTEHVRSAYSPEEVRDLLRQSKLQNWQVKDSFFWLSVLSDV
jgi:ubiquinone/menaquinone biosynthesis C-methylase UbiE